MILINNDEPANEENKTISIQNCTREHIFEHSGLYLIAGANILLGPVDVNTVCNIGRLLLNGHQEVQRAPIKAYTKDVCFVYICGFSTG